MEYSYSLSIGHSITTDKSYKVPYIWINFKNYVIGRRGNYRKDAEAELSLFNAVLDLANTQLLFKSEIDKTFFLLKFA